MIKAILSSIAKFCTTITAIRSDGSMFYIGLNQYIESKRPTSIAEIERYTREYINARNSFY